MLTVDRILCIERRGLYHLRPGSRFSLPQPPSAIWENKVTITTRIYTLEWWKKNGEPDSRSFRAKNDGLAIIKAMSILGIKGKLTNRKLRKAAAGKEVSLRSVGGRKLLPRPKS